MYGTAIRRLRMQVKNAFDHFWYERQQKASFWFEKALLRDCLGSMMANSYVFFLPFFLSVLPPLFFFSTIFIEPCWKRYSKAQMGNDIVICLAHGKNFVQRKVGNSIKLLQR